ncbi:MAG: hypothetical protein U9Q30_09615 [Campylobacterota bacterium]|nr:hypothetical protein [Campylobacterota bacterium]
MLKYKIILLLCLISSSFSIDTQLVPVSIKSINYKEEVNSSKYILVEVNDTNKLIYNIRCKDYADINKLKSNKYRAKHYIKKNKVICKKSLYTIANNKINFDFGSFEIESFGKVIQETNQYVKIRKPNGKIEKIYKDGSRL